MIEFGGGVLDPGRWSVFQNVASLVSIGSTNDLAREVIDVYFREEQALPATVFIAEEQPAARGRNGRPWKAPKGRGIYLTFVRAVPEGEPLSVVPIAVARWTREALKDACGIEAELKWPNDLYVGRRKLAGVLAEARTQGDETYLAVGIGINVLGRAADVGVAGRDDRRSGDGGSARGPRSAAGASRSTRPGAREPPLGAGGRGVGARLRSTGPAIGCAFSARARRSPASTWGSTPSGSCG